MLELVRWAQVAAGPTLEVALGTLESMMPHPRVESVVQGIRDSSGIPLGLRRARIASRLLKSKERSRT